MKILVKAAFLNFLILSSFGCTLNEENFENKNVISSSNGEVIELNYFKLFDDADVIEKMIDEYEVLNPGVKINYKKFNNFDEYVKLIESEILEGEGPDIFSMQNSWFAYKTEMVNPLPSNILSLDQFRNEFVDVAYFDLVNSFSSNEKAIYGLPYYVDNLALYYNKDHFNEIGKVAPGQTWEEVIGEANELKKINSVNNIERSGIAMGDMASILRSVDVLYLLMVQKNIGLGLSMNDLIEFSQTDLENLYFIFN